MIKQLLVAATAAVVCMGAQAAYKDGTYNGVGSGNASQIEVAVTVAGGKITEVKVLKHGETEMIFGAAEKRMTKNIVKNNGTEGVETLSGATNSSKGILDAVNDALKSAR